LTLLFVAALPNFVVALIARDLLIWQVGWLSLAHMPVFAPSYLLNPLYMLLPASALALTPGAIWQALAHTPAQAAQAAGNWHMAQFCRSVLPILPILLLQVFLTEYVLSIPGLGALGLQALKRRDIPVLQGFFVCTCALYFALHLLVEWGARLRHQSLPPLACMVRMSLPQCPSRHDLYRGLFGLGMILALAVWAQHLAPFDANELHTGAQLRQPGYRYILGTDFLGRDVLSRTLDGFRHAIPRTFLVTAIIGGVAALLLALACLLPRFMRHSISIGLAVIHAIPPFMLAFMVFLMIEPHPWAWEVALVLSFLPLAVQWLNLPVPLFNRVMSLTQIGSQILILDIAFRFLNVTPDSSMPSWGGDMRHGLTYSQRNVWLLLAPSLALVWSHYSFHLVSHYLPARNNAPFFHARTWHDDEVPTAAKGR
jgi:ABC-type dipeptide/oligopeptide/nickel transport system permease subunit